LRTDFFAPIQYTTYVEKQPVMVTDPIYLKVNVTSKHMQNMISQEWKIGTILFESGLATLGMLEKVVVEYKNEVAMIPATRTPYHETLSKVDGKQVGRFLPVYFERNTNDIIINIYVAIAYLEELNVAVVNHFESFIIPKIISLDLNNERIPLFSPLTHQGKSYMELLNYSAFKVETREVTYKRQCVNQQTISYAITHVETDPIDVKDIDFANDAYNIAHPTDVPLKMFNKIYPNDAFISRSSQSIRIYNSDEIVFLMDQTIRFKVAANLSMDACVDYSTTFPRLQERYARSLKSLAPDQHVKIMNGFQAFRAAKTAIDNNALNYREMIVLMKELMQGVGQITITSWKTLMTKVIRYQTLANENVLFEYTDKVAAMKDAEKTIQEVLKVMPNPSAFSELVFPSGFTYPAVRSSSCCTNFFVSLNTSMIDLCDFHTKVYLKYIDNPDFLASLQITSELLPNIARNFCEDIQSFSNRDVPADLN